MDKEIIVTDEMAAAGLREFEHIKDSCPDYLLVVQVYKAMRLAAAGTDLGEKQSDRLTSEETGALKRRFYEMHTGPRWPFWLIGLLLLAWALFLPLCLGRIICS